MAPHPPAELITYISNPFHLAHAITNIKTLIPSLPSLWHRRLGNPGQHVTSTLSPCPKLLYLFKQFMLIYGHLQFQVFPVVNINLFCLMTSLTTYGLTLFNTSMMFLRFLSPFTSSSIHNSTYPSRHFNVIMANSKIVVSLNSLTNTTLFPDFPVHTHHPKMAMLNV